MKSLIPNALTALNLVFGMFAIIFAINQDLTMAAIFVILAMVADANDGRVARMFGISSEFGKELDSLCDLVSFGVAPAIMAYMFMLQDYGLVGSLVCIAFPVCGALRLARFNVNTANIVGYFQGFPIPGAGCVLATFIMLGIKPSGWMFLIFVAVFAYLMISNVKYPDFKGKGKGEPIRIIPIVLTLLIGIYIIYLSPNIPGMIFVGFFGYALFGILNSIFGLLSSK